MPWCMINNEYISAMSFQKKAVMDNRSEIPYAWQSFNKGLHKHKVCCTIGSW